MPSVAAAAAPLLTAAFGVDFGVHPAIDKAPTNPTALVSSFYVAV